MQEVDLLVVCASAFVAVIVLLSLLSGVIRLLTVLFPERRAEGPDPAFEAALRMAVERALPGARVSRIEEIKKVSRT